jgi:hypothetical protein
LALNLDLDSIWAMMGQWREQAAESKAQRIKLAHAMAETHLMAGYDVVVPNILDTEDLQHFEGIAQKCGAVLCEFILMADKDEAIARFIRRGQSEGYDSGFTPGGMLERAGGVQKLAAMYDSLQVVIQDRPNATIIEPMYGDVESTYGRIASMTDVT